MKKTIGIAIIIIGAASFLYLTKLDQPSEPTPTPEEWKTYRSELFGWELKYPPTWHEEICTDNENYVFASFGDKPQLVICNSDAIPTGYINVVAAKKEGDYDLEREISQAETNLDNFSRRHQTINGQEWVRLEGTIKQLDGPLPATGTKYILIILPRGDKVYRLIRFGEERLAEFEQVLNSINIRN